VGFDDLLRGRPARIELLTSRTQAAAVQPNVKSLRERVLTGVRRGLYRPKDLLHVLDGRAAIGEKPQRYPTPAGIFLA
jgi:hypothetical protein